MHLCLYLYYHLFPQTVKHNYLYSVPSSKVRDPLYVLDNSYESVAFIFFLLNLFPLFHELTAFILTWSLRVTRHIFTPYVVNFSQQSLQVLSGPFQNPTGRWEDCWIEKPGLNHVYLFVSCVAVKNPPYSNSFAFSVYTWTQMAAMKFSVWIPHWALRIS